MTAASVIGPSFTGRIVSETGTDPFPQGYIVADTWRGNGIQPRKEPAC